MSQYYIDKLGRKREIPKEEENWRAPEHSRMSAMRRHRGRPVEAEDGTIAIHQGELLMPEPTCLKLQRQSDWLKEHPGCQLPKHLR